MPPSEYLGQTIDLFGDHLATPESKRGSPESNPPTGAALFAISSGD
jgi:hypothetical protein